MFDYTLDELDLINNFKDEICQIDPYHNISFYDYNEDNKVLSLKRNEY